MTVTRPLSRLLLPLCGVLALAGSSTCLADTLQMPESTQETATSAEPWNVAVPKRGINKAQVESQFGSPESKQGPTGEPPIYFWEYPEFTVYFESDFVIHTVRKYQPK